MDPVVKEPVIVTDDKSTEGQPEVPETKPGEKTDSALLLKSLQEEREKRRIAEAEAAALKTAHADVFSAEGQALQAKMLELETKLSAREKADMLTSLQTKYPALKDKTAEFEQYLSENEGMKLETAAKSFVVENDLLETPARKGLERAGGGGRSAPKQGMTIEEVDELRKTNYRKYTSMLRNGEINV